MFNFLKKKPKLINIPDSWSICNMSDGSIMRINVGLENWCDSTFYPVCFIIAVPFSSYHAEDDTSSMIEDMIIDVCQNSGEGVLAAVIPSQKETRDFIVYTKRHPQQFRAGEQLMDEFPEVEFNFLVDEELGWDLFKKHLPQIQR